MIDVIKYDDGFPVSVIIPHGKSNIRNNFFENFCLPSIEGMQPREIIINDNNGSAPKKRNDGFDKSTQPFILFSDNDILFPANFLEKTVFVLENNPKKGYAYGGYYGIVQNPRTHPIKNNFKIEGLPFDGKRLENGNYISTMSLIKREHFPRFDENLKRLQDWDIWLTLWRKGIEGILVNGIEFYAYYLDEGITSNTNNEQQAITAIIRKHKLGM